jgi:hypothetical protein
VVDGAFDVNQRRATARDDVRVQSDLEVVVPSTVVDGHFLDERVDEVLGCERLCAASHEWFVARTAVRLVSV